MVYILDLKGKYLLPLQTNFVSNFRLTLTVKGVLLKPISWKIFSSIVRISSGFNTDVISPRVAIGININLISNLIVKPTHAHFQFLYINTLRTGDADLRLGI